MPDSDYMIDRAELLRYLGHGGQTIDSELERRIDEMSDLCLKTAEPKYCYGVFNVEETADGVELIKTGVIFKGSDIRKHLCGAKSCAVMAVTIGMRAERELLRLEYKSVSDALIFNAACTALVENVADKCESEIVELGKSRGLSTNFRYSPGYGDFPLEQQPEVLGLISASQRVGITLTDSLLMLPRKSVSAVIGMFPGDAAKSERQSSCESCNNRENCEFRKRGVTCGK